MSKYIRLLVVAFVVALLLGAVLTSVASAWGPWYPSWGGCGYPAYWGGGWGYHAYWGGSWGYPAYWGGGYPYWGGGYPYWGGGYPYWGGGWW